MKKILTTLFVVMLPAFLVASTASAGKQELTVQNVKKAWAKNATQADFCKLHASADFIKAFSASLATGGNADQDASLSDVVNIPCTGNDTAIPELKKVIYGTLRVQRVGMDAPDEELEQVFVIDDYIIRPVNYMADLYNPGATDINFNESGSVYGAVRGVRSFKASLASPIEGTGLDAGYYVHLTPSGSIDGFFVLYKDGIYRFTETQKEITDLILVDYTQPGSVQQ